MTRGVHRLALALALAAFFAFALSACGSDSSDSTSNAGTASAESEAPETSGKPSQGGGTGRGDSQRSDSSDGSAAGGGDSSADEGSASFRVPGGDNSIQNYGEEGDESEREAAGTAVAAYLDARAAGDSAAQCKYLAKTTVAPMEQLAKQTSAKANRCAEVLEKLTGNAPASALVNTLTGPIASLRTEGERGFVLYHGPEGVDYFVPMVKEDGKWKVAAIAPTEILR